MNKPVAWIDSERLYLGLDGDVFWDDAMSNEPKEGFVPLYTHPVRELTDSEIRTIQDMCHLKNVGYNNFIMRFARAILKKAREV